MKKRLSVVLAAVLTLSGLFAQPVSAVTYEGLCVQNEWDPNLTGQYYFDKTVSLSTFDEIHAWVTARKLYPCEGLSYQGWSFAAVANLQAPGASGCNRCIWQLGYLTEGGNAGDQPYFVYTSPSGDGVYHLITSVRPTLGSRYHFKIYEYSTGKLRYMILDSSGTNIWSYITSQAWLTQMTFAWWGWESSNSKSMGGLQDGAAAADLVGQYSLVGYPSVVTVTGLTAIDHCNVPPGSQSCSYRQFLQVSGTNDEIFNVFGLSTE